MKTTIELPENLLIAAKQHAAAHRTTLKVLIESGLRRELEQAARETKSPKIRWITAKGGLPRGLDVSDRSQMIEWSTRERSKLLRRK